MRKIVVETSKKYDIIIDNNILKDCGKYVKNIINPCKACIVTDDTVAKLYLDTVKKSLSENGFSVIEYIFPHGELSKNADTLISAVEFFAKNCMTRSDVVIALGGGVVGDLAGFAASTYLRGIRFVQIPTTFLANIDSSVGGKTAVNLKAGKNLWGAFHQPSLVICDTKCLETLDHTYFLDGVAEAVKYAVLEDETLVEVLKNDIEETIFRCVEIKKNIVNNDEFENSTRKLLNFGHTFGHSIEALSNFSVTHGHAVAIGMVIVSRGAERMGITKQGTTDRLINILKDFGLPVTCSYTAKQLAMHAMVDKKREGDSITIIVPEEIGKCRLFKIPVSKLEEFASE